MNILIVSNSLIPAIYYGGTERVIWYLGKELVKLGHKLTYLVREGSTCDFADVYHLDMNKPISDQIPKDVDVVHFNFNPNQTIDKPYIITEHGNGSNLLDINTVFVSKNHAERYGSASYVYNGLDWSDYSPVDLHSTKNYFHFLGDAGWRVKNVKGAINVFLSTRQSGKLAVLGGHRLNFRMGFRFTISPRIKFYGMVGGQKKIDLLQASKGLIFPVRWHEPFGLAITESLYCGCPVFGTPYGSLPEIVNNEVGFLSAKSDELIDAINNVDTYSRKRCHEYAQDCFNSNIMALAYIEKYNAVLKGEKLNSNAPVLQKVQQTKFLAWE